jgi:hypothetical protein
LMRHLANRRSTQRTLGPRRGGGGERHSQTYSSAAGTWKPARLPSVDASPRVIGLRPIEPSPIVQHTLRRPSRDPPAEATELRGVIPR